MAIGIHILRTIYVRASQAANPVSTRQRGKVPTRVYWIFNFMLAAGFLSTLVNVATKSGSNWPEAWLLLLATFSTLAALGRQLPAQNILLATFIIVLIGGAVHTFGAMSGIPFGQIMFGPEVGVKIFGILPWVTPLLWVVAVLNSRGLARLILRPWRKLRTYGFWLIGLTALFTMLFDCALEPVATRIKRYWIWTSPGHSLMPQGAPLSNSVGWFIVTLLILAFATPILINKQLSKRSALDFHPASVWLGAILLFAIAAAVNRLWAATAADTSIGISVAFFAIRGGCW